MDRNEYILLDGVVVSTDDEAGGGRIKVRLGNKYDGSRSDRDLPYCSPLLPKLIHVVPKPGEHVFVMTQKIESGDSSRFYIGPTLSQPYYYSDESAATATGLIYSSPVRTVQPDPALDPRNAGTMPPADSVGIIGRKNADLALMDNEVRIRCGYMGHPDADVSSRLHASDGGFAFIQMKWKEVAERGTDAPASSVNVMADRINLLSRHSDRIYADKGTGDPITTKNLVTDGVMESIIEEAHVLPYGDVLADFLRRFVSVFASHTHPFPMLPPSLDDAGKEVVSQDFDAMLSKAVRIS